MKRLITILSITLLISSQLLAQGWNYATSTGTTFILFGMSFPANQNDVGFACGMQYTYNADGVVIKTTDGGENWTQVLPASGSIDGLQGIWFISETIGFAGGWNNYFIKTTDGGATWVPVTCGTNVWYYVDVEFWDSNNGVAAASMNSSSDQAVFITSDGGNSWVPATSGTDANIMGITYADQNTLFTVGTDGKVRKSTDGGHNFTVVSTLPAMLFGLDFANSTFGVVGGEEKMFATNDGGSSWTTYTTGYENFYAAKAFSDGTAYIGGTDENIYTTSDYGVSWIMEHNGTGTSHLYRLRSTPDGSLIACGSQGTVIKKEPDFGAGFTSDTDSVCVGNDVSFTDLSTGSITSWSWTFEGGTPSSSTDQNPVITYNSTGIFDVTLEVSDGSNTSTLSIPDMITVLEDPIAPSQPTGTTEMCAGETTDYTIQPVPNADSYSWEVDPVDAGSITGSGTTGTFNSDGDYSGAYTIKVKASNMCGYGPWSPELSCTLNMKPQEYVLSDGGSFCEGGQGIELTQDGSETGVDYELFLEGITTGTVLAGTGNPLSYGYQTEEGIYTVTGSTGICTENMLGTPYIFYENEPSQGNIPVGENIVCSGESEVYSIDPIANADSIIWSLTPEDAGEIIGTGETITINWNDNFTGLANLTTQGSNDCGLGIISDPLEVEVFELPIPEITGSELVCDFEESEYSTYNNPGNSYSWVVSGGEIISGQNTNMITVAWGEPGTGTISLTEVNLYDCEGVTEEFEVLIDDCTNIHESTTSSLKIYPIPASENINIKFNIAAGEFYEMEIKNLVGQTKYITSGISQENSQNISVDISNFSNGRYVIMLLNKSGNVIIDSFIIIK